MDRYVQGENDAFLVVYDLLVPRLQALLLSHGCSRALADDLLQQTFLRIHRGRDRYASGQDVTPWVLAIARRLIVDSWRRSRREIPEHPALHSTADLADPERNAIVAETARRLRQRIVCLPAAQRRAFELVKIDGLTLAQAATILGTTIAAVKLRLHRAHVSLRCDDAISNDNAIR